REEPPEEITYMRGLPGFQNLSHQSAPPLHYGGDGQDLSQVVMVDHFLTPLPQPHRPVTVRDPLEGSPVEPSFPQHRPHYLAHALTFHSAQSSYPGSDQTTATTRAVLVIDMN